MSNTSRPSSQIDWATGDASYISEPSTPVKNLGWTKNQRPPYQTMNWVLWNILQWIQWFDFLTHSGTTFAFANGQGSAANVTGLSVSSASLKMAEVTFHVHRKTATNEVRCTTKLYLLYKELTSTWVIGEQVNFGDDPGIVFTITAGGQVQYTSDTLAGSGYTDDSSFRYTSM